jgi:Ni/Co efflux regulator RcnB
MRLVHRAIAISTLALTLAGGVAIAQEGRPDQDHHDQSHYVKHDDWKKGRHIQREDWNRGEQVADWRAYHLHEPPKGYEWRRIDGQYVCAKSDGVIFKVVVAP